MPILNVCYLGRVQKVFIVVARLLGGVLRYKYMQNKNIKLGKLKLVEMLVRIIWFMPTLRVNSPYLYLFCGQIGAKVVDSGWFEYYGGRGGRVCLLSVSEAIQISQKRVIVKGYIVRVIVSGICLLIAY